MSNEDPIQRTFAAVPMTLGYVRGELKRLRDEKLDLNHRIADLVESEKLLARMARIAEEHTGRDERDETVEPLSDVLDSRRSEDDGSDL